MFNDPETNLRLARQRERELIAEADRERQAKAARDHGRGSDTRSHGRR